MNRPKREARIIEINKKKYYVTVRIRLSLKEQEKSSN